MQAAAPPLPAPALPAPAPSSLHGLPALPAPVLGLVAGARGVTFDFRAPAPNRFLCEILHPTTVADIALFLLPGQSLPPGAGLVGFFSTPPFAAWTPLPGCRLDASRPSVICATGWPTNADLAGAPVLQLGLSLEPLEAVVALERAADAEQRGLAQLVAKDLAAFLASFSGVAGADGRIVLAPNALERWLSKFDAKWRASGGPRFLYASS